MPKERKVESIILQVLTPLSILLLTVIVCIGLFIFLPSSSHHKKTVRVPDVREKNLVSAINILYKHKLRVSKVYETHHLPKNYVISQYPLPGTEVKIGRRIELKVSSGKYAVVRVPNLQNLHITEAKYQLSNSTLHIGRLSYTYSSIEKDHVITQTPLYNTKVPKDSKVNLLISKGERPVTFYMPDLVGMKFEKATQIIKDMGLRITRIEEKVCDEYERGVIISQKPLRGYRVSAGEGVSLIVTNNTDDTSIFK